MKKDDSPRPNAAPRPDGAAPAKPAVRPRLETKTVFSLSESETLEFGRSFARQLKGGELIVLQGDLGMGKTVFARGVAVGLGIEPEEVSSPSYALIHEYHGGRLEMFHVDLYRLDQPEETETLGIEDLLTSGGIVVAEWGERLPTFFRRDAILIRFHDVGEGSRRIEVLPAEAAGGAPASDA
jgi:tRNA threonylcarbamoyladenosine biosynthesis protein TsaE